MDPSSSAASERLPVRPAPRPGIAEPKLRQQVQRRLIWSPIVDGDLGEDVLRTRFEVLHEDIPVTVAIDNAGINQLVLFIPQAASRVLFRQASVREFTLRILVEHLEIRMRWRRVEVVVIFLYVLAMVTLAVTQAEQSLLQDRIPAIPKR